MYNDPENKVIINFFLTAEFAKRWRTDKRVPVIRWAKKVGKVFRDESRKHCQFGVRVEYVDPQSAISVKSA